MLFKEKTKIMNLFVSTIGIQRLKMLKRRLEMVECVVTRGNSWCGGSKVKYSCMNTTSLKTIYNTNKTFYITNKTFDTTNKTFYITNKTFYTMSRIFYVCQEHIMNIIDTYGYVENFR